jgi:hypothetical protein
VAVGLDCCLDVAMPCVPDGRQGQLGRKLHVGLVECPIASRLVMEYTRQLRTQLIQAAATHGTGTGTGTGRSASKVLWDPKMRRCKDLCICT